MKITVDTERGTLDVESDGPARTIDLYGDEAFEILSEQWLRVGWNQKYSYRFTWLGRPVIQLPEDLMRLQEAIWATKPDVIIETGIAHGGSLVFHASLCKAIGSGRVIGVDREIRAPNRTAIESHPLAPYITMIEGSSVDRAVIDSVRKLVAPSERVMVILDSNHSYEHVLEELHSYSELVSPGAYLVVADGLMNRIWDVPRAGRHWERDNPARAVEQFLKVDSAFELVSAPRGFNESTIEGDLTYFDSGWLRRKSINQQS